MNFVEQIKILAARIPSQLEHIKTEAATRNALIEPFIRALGYDTSNLTEVVPEFGADLNVPGVPKNKKIDYGILKDGKPIILIECKCYNDKLDEGYKQLFHYAVATDCRIGVLTNGLIYRFYADLDRPNKLDESPFLEIDMLNLNEDILDDLKHLTKSSLDVGEMLTAASELKYVVGILQILNAQYDAPTEEFAKFFFQQLCPGRQFAGGIKSQFMGFTQKSLKQFVRDQINRSLDATDTGKKAPESMSKAPRSDDDRESDDPNSQNGGRLIETTEEELEGFYIVKAIIREVVPADTIFYRDGQTYFSILLDNNNRKPICRLYFNNPKNKRLVLFDKNGDDKQEDKISISTVDDIYSYADRLRSTVTRYKKSAENGNP